MRGHSRWRARGAGVSLFVEDGAYTTIAAAVAMLMVLALLFSASLAVWSSSRASDVQVSADTTALAGANVVASYYTVATVLDSCVLSMGLAGFTMTGAGLVGLLVPGVNAAAGKTLEAGVRMLNARNSFAESASRGLEKLEGSLPYLVAANGTRTCAAQHTELMAYTGTALALPRESASSFPAIEGPAVDTDALEQAGDELDEVAHKLSEAAEDTADAKERAWRADCGRDGMNMQERAAALSGISELENPDFASSLTWDPRVGLERARAYYRWRFEHDEPSGQGVEARADAAARHVFYGYALEQLEGMDVSERDGQVTATIELLPKNTEEVRATALYTDAIWPTSVEDAGVTLHFSADCPGALGAVGPMSAVRDIETGAVRECETCRFGVGDIGKAPAASTLIDNGFEYHLREYMLALKDYAACRNRELELERTARGEADDAGNAFEDAIAGLASGRPRIAPPGRDGCIALVVQDAMDAPDGLTSSFAADQGVEPRAAIAAATLTLDPATRENNVLSRFFSGLEERVGADGPAGLVDGVMDLWGDLLISYGDISNALGAVTDDLLSGLEDLGAGPVARWLGDRIAGIVGALGLDPVDLSLRKPVLADSARVLEDAGATGVVDVQEMLRSIPVGSLDADAILRAIGYEVGTYIESLEFTVAEIPLPNGGSIPITVRLRDVIGPIGDAA